MFSKGGGWLNKTFCPMSTHASFNTLKLLPAIEPLLSKYSIKLFPSLLLSSYLSPSYKLSISLALILNSIWLKTIPDSPILKCFTLNIFFYFSITIYFIIDFLKSFKYLNKIILLYIRQENIIFQLYLLIYITWYIISIFYYQKRS